MRLDDRRAPRRTLLPLSTLAALAVLGGAAPGTPAAAAAPVPAPPPGLSAARSALGCTLTDLDEVNARLDAVAAPSIDEIVVAGRMASGSRAWVLAPSGYRQVEWPGIEAAPVRSDAAADGTTVVAGRSAVQVRRTGSWTRVPYPAGTPAPVGVAALPAGGVAVLGSDGRVRVRAATWTTLPAPAGRVLAVAAPSGLPRVVTVESLGAAARLRVATWAGGRWRTTRELLVPDPDARALRAADPGRTVWSATVSGGLLAVSTRLSLAALVDLGTGRVIGTRAAGSSAPVTAARPLPGDRHVLAHAGAAPAGRVPRGSLGVVADGSERTVPGSVGAPVPALATTSGPRPRLVVLRANDWGGGEESTTVTTCG